MRLCRDAGLPRPAVNVPIAGLGLDFAWPSQQLVVELDGYAFHRDRGSFERDRRRDARLQLAGYRVIRVTHRRLAEEPEAVVAELRVLLGLAGGPLAHSPSR
jgi:very-short-patch-repair endonuclease